MGVAGPTHDARSWTFDLDPGGRDPVLGIERLQEAFLARFPDYEKGITVPAIVDVTTGQVVTNDYPQITLDLSLEWREHPREAPPRPYPEAPRPATHEVKGVGFYDGNTGRYLWGLDRITAVYASTPGRTFSRPLRPTARPAVPDRPRVA